MGVISNGLRVRVSSMIVSGVENGKIDCTRKCGERAPLRKDFSSRLSGAGEQGGDSFAGAEFGDFLRFCAEYGTLYPYEAG